MKFDSYGALVMERDGFPADLGDSAHETSRCHILGRDIEAAVFQNFVSNAGFLRHPDAPYADAVGDSWRESDATSDLVFPLLMALDMHWEPRALSLASEIRGRIKSTWMVAPGHIASPALIALVYKLPRVLRALTIAQRWIFKLGWRWSDSEQMKGKLLKFERTTGSAADYLNWFCSIIYLFYEYRILVDFEPETVQRKVLEYYQAQPNSEWFIQLWFDAIDRTAKLRNLR